MCGYTVNVTLYLYIILHFYAGCNISVEDYIFWYTFPRISSSGSSLICLEYFYLNFCRISGYSKWWSTSYRAPINIRDHPIPGLSTFEARINLLWYYVVSSLFLLSFEFRWKFCFDVDINFQKSLISRCFYGIR